MMRIDAMREQREMREDLIETVADAGQFAVSCLEDDYSGLEDLQRELLSQLSDVRMAMYAKRSADRDGLDSVNDRV